MMENVVPAGGSGAVEFDDSSAANSAENRLTLLRALVEDVIRSSETSFTHQIKVDETIWNIRVEQQS